MHENHCLSYIYPQMFKCINCGISFTTQANRHIQGGPKKVSHYRQSSLNRIKNRKPG